jgi:hypothetical protein
MASTLLLAAACGNGSDDAASPVNGAAATPTVATAITPAADLPAPVRLALETAARDAGVPVTQVELLDFEAVEWRTSGLGCERPGQVYAQVITPGYRVTARAAGSEAEYHTDDGTSIVRCDTT